jgi:hypothetical protein
MSYSTVITTQISLFNDVVTDLDRTLNILSWNILCFVQLRAIYVYVLVRVVPSPCFT